MMMIDDNNNNNNANVLPPPTFQIDRQGPTARQLVVIAERCLALLI